MHHAIGTRGFAHGHEAAERNHVATRVARLEPAYVFQLQPEGRLRLGIDLAGAPEATLVREYKQQVRSKLRAMARETGARNPEALGDARLMLLMDGSYFTRLVFPGRHGPMPRCSARYAR